jgi:hypothetical protein
MAEKFFFQILRPREAGVGGGENTHFDSRSFQKHKGVVDAIIVTTGKSGKSSEDTSSRL